VSLDRCVVRLDKEMVTAVDQLAARARREGEQRRSRAALVRSMLAQQIARLDAALPLAAQLPELPRAPHGRRTRKREGASMRARILGAMGEHPGEVFTSARLAPLVGAASRDSVRNTLLVLAERRLVEKLGPGLYRARLPEPPPPSCAAGAPR
jgi:hypothetical protein